MSRVIQAVVIVTTLKTVISAYPFHPFYPESVVMYVAFEGLFYLVKIGIAAFIATLIPASVRWAQKLVFFGLVVSPSIFSSYFFYRNVSLYWVGGRELVRDHRITTAGFENFLTSLGIAAFLALAAALVYFRAGPHSRSV